MGIVCCREDLVELDGEVELAHFSLLRSVGKGAFGKVRVVQHKGSKQLYALKYINKNKCIQMRAVENVISERRLLENIHCDFIVNLRYAFQDDENLFMILDLMLGGDLRFHLERLSTLPEDYVRFYAAEMAIALNYLHTRNIIHRDLKPDNILLDEQGHAHLTDFNIATVIYKNKPLLSVAGSLAYIAPEVLMKRGYLTSIDWWSLGIVLYELLFGKRPFRGKSNESLQKAILTDPILIPDNHNLSRDALDFLKGLLERDVDQRLGVGEEGFKRVKEHPWFKEIDWNKLELKQLQPPFLPDNKRANFDPTHELEEILLEDNPLRVRKRAHHNKPTSHHSSSHHSSHDISTPTTTNPDLQIMEEKFVTFDFTKPDENENRRKQMEQRYYATRMNKKTTVSNLSKPTATYKGSVLDHLNEKPSTPLSAGDILKVEELARMARTTGGTEWRPPSGLMDRDKSSPADLLQARDHYIMENGGVPPPSRPPPPPVTTNYFRRASDDTFAIEHHKDSSVSTTSSHTTNDTRRSLSALPRQ